MAERVVVPRSRPPDETVAVIGAALVDTVFPPASRTVTRGWVENRAPAVTPTDGRVSSRDAAAPTVAVNVCEVVSEPDVKVMR